MSNINRVIISGRLTRDPELRALPGSEISVAELGVAVNRSRKTESGYEDEAHFFDVSVYAGRGETVARKARKGDSITVEGRLQQRRWEDKETGKNREKVSIVADSVEGEFMFRSKDEDRDVSAEAPAEVETSNQTDDIPF